MEYIFHKQSPIGMLTLSSDGTNLTGIWIENQKYFCATLPENQKKENLPVFTQTARWLDLYFTGQNPEINIPLAPKGSEFRQYVWETLRTIPYGQTITYGEIAEILYTKTGKKQSARAVGGAVGHNPISILIPCHRVIGANGSLTGYAGGLDKKTYLLDLEKSLTAIK